MRYNRAYILLIAFSLALFCSTAAFSAMAFSHFGDAPVPVSDTVTAQIQLPGKNAVMPCQVRSEEGEVWIYWGDGQRSDTGLSTRLLPRSDRAALELGIQVEDQQELAALLEDLGS